MIGTSDDIKLGRESAPAVLTSPATFSSGATASATASATGTVGAVRAAGLKSSRMEKTAQSRLAQTTQRMRSGVSLKDRVLRLRVYKNCFTGADAVSWMMSDRGCTATEAVAHELGVSANLVCVLRSQPFH